MTRSTRRLLTLAAITLLTTVPTARATAIPVPPTGETQGSTLGYFHPVSPVRALDTRDGTGGTSGPLGTGGELVLGLAGRLGIPAGASAVVMNVTAVQPTAGGYLTVYPNGETRPLASAINFAPGDVIANLVTAKIGGDGSVRIFNFSGSTHVVADVVGWYDDILASFPTIAPGAGKFVPLSPTRILDTRDGTGAPVGAIRGGGELALQISGRGGTPTSGVSAVTLKVTAVTPTAPGYLTVYPSGEPRPLASALNFGAGEVVPNLVTAKVGADGRIRIFNFAGSTHVVADIVGYYAPVGTDALQGGEMVPLTPARVLDTRDGTGASAARIGAGGEIALQLAGRAGLPASGVAAVTMNVTAVSPTAAGYLTIYPSGEPRPLASAINFGPGDVVANLITAKVGADGRVRIFNFAGSTDVVADVVGYFASDGTATLGGATVAGAPVDGTPDVVTAARSSVRLDVAAQEAFWSAHDPATLLAAATPAPLLEREDPAAAGESPERLVDHANETSRFPITRQGYTYPNSDRRIGRLLYFIPGRGWNYCTATLVARNLVLTAAHCVVGANNAGQVVWNTNFAFFAGLSGLDTSGGVWTGADRVATPQTSGVPWYLRSDWSFDGRQGFYPADYALVGFGPDSSGRYPGDVNSWFPISAQPRLGWLYGYGYPGEGSYFNRYCGNGDLSAAADRYWCYLYYNLSPWRSNQYAQHQPGWYEIGWGSDMSGGASGGPVFGNVDGRWSIVSLNSNGQTEPGMIDAAGRRHVLNMWGPYFTNTIIELWNANAIR